ncbi:MAG: radical SAM protein [Candidatus Omnitrophota bacterium]|nr:radical SAM protein [Candidatus Omnitrophota bacterium]
MKKIKKALLFIPPAVTFKDRIDINPMPPLGLGYLAAVLEREGIETKIVDCLIDGWSDHAEISDKMIRIGLSFKEIEKIIESYGPDIVGVNNLFTIQRQNAHEIYKIAKKVNNMIITVAGGAHPTVMPELVLSDPNTDYVVLGEGERTIIDLVHLLEGRCDLSGLDGFGYRKDSRIKVLPKKRFIDDLDSLPFPARHLLNMDKYFGLRSSHGDRRKRRFSPVITSRGCPARCSFCSAYAVWGRSFRPRSCENVIKELKQIKAEYGIEEIMFEDDNLTLDSKRAEAIFDGMVQSRLDMEWDTPNGIAAWTLSECLIDKMKKSGCRTINFAVESGNKDVLDRLIKKPLNLDKVKPLVKYAKSIGLNVGLFLVIGMPGETEDQMWDSFSLSRELGVFTPHISIATPYPGSELYDICKKQNYLCSDFTLDDLHIRSFAVSTPEFDGKKLKKILAEGEKYLLRSFFINSPMLFLKKCLWKLLGDPIYFIKKVSIFIRQKSGEGLR